MRLILASSSQGRKKILKSLGLPFKIVASSIDEEKIIAENPLKTLQLRAKLKGEEVAKQITDNKQQITSYLVLSADSGVIIDNRLIGKPKSYKDAVRILKTLSGKTHEFVTAIYAIKISNLPSITLRTSKSQIFPPQRDPASGGTNLNLKSKNFEERKAILKETILECEIPRETSYLKRIGYFAQKNGDRNKSRATEKFVSEGLPMTSWQDYERSFVTFRELAPNDINLYLSLTDYTKYAGGYALVSAQNFITKVEGSISNVIGLPLEKIIPILKENKLLP